MLLNWPLRSYHHPEVVDFHLHEEMKIHNVSLEAISSI
jgi:hypothetical protein